MLIPDLKRAKTRFTKLSKTQFISGLSAGNREPMLKLYVNARKVDGATQSVDKVFAGVCKLTYIENLKGYKNGTGGILKLN
jgi:hypothetical protein